MQFISAPEFSRLENPLDVVESVAAHRQWPFERDEENEISISVTGLNADYAVSYTWIEELESLHFSCSFPLRVPAHKRGEVVELLGQINEQMFIGHFDLWSKEGTVLYRHALVLAGGAAPSDRQCETVLNLGVEACERYYQAFQFVVWADKSPRHALDLVLFETAGNA